MVNETLNTSRAMEELTGRLFALSRALRSAGQRGTFRSVGVRRSDVGLLRILEEHGPQRPGAVADHLGVGPSVVSRQLVTLHKEGLISRRADPADGRAELVEITESGSLQLAEIVREYVQLLTERFAHWDDARVDEASRFLFELTAVVNGVESASLPTATPTAAEAPADSEGRN